MVIWVFISSSRALECSVIASFLAFFQSLSLFRLRIDLSPDMFGPRVCFWTRYSFFYSWKFSVFLTFTRPSNISNYRHCICMFVCLYENHIREHLWKLQKRNGKLLFSYTYISFDLRSRYGYTYSCRRDLSHLQLVVSHHDISNKTRCLF